MSSVFAIGLSGMRLAQVSLGASAHNIANLSTTPFRRQQVVAETAESGGVNAALRTSSVEGPALEADIVGLLEAKNSFAANLQVFKTADRMLGTLLDTRG